MNVVAGMWRHLSSSRGNTPMGEGIQVLLTRRSVINSHRILPCLSLIWSLPRRIVITPFRLINFNFLYYENSTYLSFCDERTFPLCSPFSFSFSESLPGLEMAARSNSDQQSYHPPRNRWFNSFHASGERIFNFPFWENWTYCASSLYSLFSFLSIFFSKSLPIVQMA